MNTETQELQQKTKEELIELLKIERDSNAMYKMKLEAYEQNGAAKLYYSLQRKSNEMADLLNNKNLTSIVIDDPKDKTFDRLKSIWTDADGLANAIKTLGSLAGVTGNEKEDVERKPFVDSIPESRK